MLRQAGPDRTVLQHGGVSRGTFGCRTLYHNWQPDSGVIELTSASTDRRWLTKTVVKAMFHMAFAMIGAQLVALRVSERNTGMVAKLRSGSGSKVC
jgi:hypothetical protein